MEKIKIKPLTKEQLIVSADRLTRFKDTETKYLRVYKEIILSNLITPKYKKSELDKLDYKTLCSLAEHIINESLKTYLPEEENDCSINQRLYDYEKSVFVIDNETEALLKNKINYKGLIKLLDENIPLNLKWLKTLEFSSNPEKESHDCGYRFPIKQLIICEGITEEILLPEFAKVLDYDFDKHGIQIISAGGKNQVVKTFYKFAANIKIPVFVLLDSDAKENYNEILPKLQPKDKIHILSGGEFEDVLPVKLIEKTLKYATENISLPMDNEIKPTDGMVHYLEEFFKNRGAHEFKKAEFAALVKQNISGIEDISPEFEKIINELKNPAIIDKN